ncbi:MAG TPA: cupredoxin domain-containing protein [Symbiobacteriaceae bacterium]|nr:cupredoxin domain-containing protein [Symbiobacteriaceae bacterium]
MKKVFMLALVAVLSMVLTACGGGGGGATTTLDVVMGEGGEMIFTPATLSVKKGDTVQVTITNKDAAQNHSFLITELNVKSKQVPPGQKETLKVTANKTGEFTFFCDVPGHKEGGMVGKLTVTE